MGLSGKITFEELNTKKYIGIALNIDSVQYRQILVTYLYWTGAQCCTFGHSYYVLLHDWRKIKVYRYFPYSNNIYRSKPNNIWIQCRKP